VQIGKERDTMEDGVKDEGDGIRCRIGQGVLGSCSWARYCEVTNKVVSAQCSGLRLLDALRWLALII
jgi:hypothetical protein